MAVAKKPSRQKKDLDQSLDSVIEKGGSSAKVQEQNEDEIKQVQLRIPSGKLNEIDRIIKKKAPKPKRHYWILEAIFEKLEREQSNQ